MQAMNPVAKWLANVRVSRKLALVISVHLLHAIVLLVLTAYAMNALIAARAYVEGEGAWSKAEKEAVLYLMQYADTGDEGHYDAYLDKINVTLGDRQARIELEKPDPDMKIVRQGFLQGRNHPDDIDKMAWLFRTFRQESHIDEAIGIWARADEEIATLMAQAEALREAIATDGPASPRVDGIVGEIIATDARLTVLEHEFSRTLGDGARFIGVVVLAGTLGLTVFFVGAAVLLSVTVARGVTRSLARLERAADGMASGATDVRVEAEGSDEVAQVSHAFNLMSVEITNARRQAATHEAKMRESEARLRSLAEASLDGVVVHDGERVIDVNATSARIFGYKPAEMVGLPIMSLVAPQSRGDVALHVSTRSEEPYEVEVLRRDGTTARMEAAGRQMTWSGRPARVVTLHDAGPRREAEARLRVLIDASPDAFVLVDARGRIVLVNTQAERIFGHARHELVGQGLDVLIPERFRARHAQHVRGYLADPHTRPMGAGMDLFALRKDGSEFPVEISLSPIELGGEQLVAAAVRDVTDRKLTEQEHRRLSVSRPLVRGILRSLIERTSADRRVLEEVGRGIAAGATASDIEGFVNAYVDLGLGELKYEGLREGRYVFTGRDLVERQESTRLTTCYLTLGYLMGAVARDAHSPHALGTEFHCQSRGDAQCEFVLHARQERS